MSKYILIFHQPSLCIWDVYAWVIFYNEIDFIVFLQTARRHCHYKLMSCVFLQRINSIKMIHYPQYNEYHVYTSQHQTFGATGSFECMMALDHYMQGKVNMQHPLLFWPLCCWLFSFFLVPTVSLVGGLDLSYKINDSTSNFLDTISILWDLEGVP